VFPAPGPGFGGKNTDVDLLEYQDDSKGHWPLSLLLSLPPFLLGMISEPHRGEEMLKWCGRPCSLSFIHPKTPPKFGSGPGTVLVLLPSDKDLCSLGVNALVK
jgi:hypothetical protein